MTQFSEKYIRFDWAMKRLLRNKANYVVLEGFLSSLLGKKIKYTDSWKVKVTRTMTRISIIV